MTVVWEEEVVLQARSDKPWLYSLLVSSYTRPAQETNYNKEGENVLFSAPFLHLSFFPSLLLLFSLSSVKIQNLKFMVQLSFLYLSTCCVGGKK